MTEKGTQRLMVVLVIFIAGDLGLQAFRLFKDHYANSVGSGISPLTAGTTITVSAEFILGDTAQKKIIVEFSDYECPFCTQHATGVYKTIHDRFIATGHVRYGFANNPLPNHLEARLLASAAVCAGLQNRLEEMHDNLYLKKPRTKSEILNLAAVLGVNRNQFDSCLTDPKTSAQIDSDITQAKKLRLTGTPAFAFGLIDSNGRITVERVLAGARPIEQFERGILELPN